jgi:3-deoxy-manno-octulosonate cytidylyltransferase (CMP-KDO synthetase)
MQSAIIIPSRYASQRLPRKALHPISGISLVERVYRKCVASGLDVFVATDHPEIQAHVERFGGNVLMTSPDCPSGTDRVAQAAAMLGDAYDIVINVQGDEPLIDPNVILATAHAIGSDTMTQCATPITPIRNLHDLTNPNIVKVVLDDEMRALYFSRSTIPYLRDIGSAISEAWIETGIFHKHIGLYAYRQAALKRFVELPESSLERCERLEQLRILQAGLQIKCVLVEYESIAVDTIEDVALVEAALLERGEA